MVYFGPSGLSNSQIDAKIDYTELPNQLKSLGISTFEYAFNMGVRISDDRAKQYKKLFEENNISLSVHGPYYINFASSDPMQIEKSINYVISSLKKMRIMGADRLVFHPGSLTKQERSVALANTMANLKELQNVIKQEGLDDMFICPETMGKHGQIGSADEVYEMCKLGDNIIPTLDFGHINSFTGGSLKTKEDFRFVIDKFVKDLGKKEIHIHFSAIKYGPKGELKHLTLDDKEYGPDYKIFLSALSDYKDINFRVISESNGTQLEDSLLMMKYYEGLKKNT